MNLIYRPPTAEDISFVAENMRVEDILEVAESHGHTPLQALVSSISVSSNSFACVIDGEPVCIFGFGITAPGESASVWLLGATGLARYPRVLLRESRRILANWRMALGYLYNFVPASSTQNIKWLSHVGFQVGVEAPVKYGVTNEPFYLLEMLPDV